MDDISLFWHIPMHHDELWMTVLAVARAYIILTNDVMLLGSYCNRKPWCQHALAKAGSRGSASRRGHDAQRDYIHTYIHTYIYIHTYKAGT